MAATITPAVLPVGLVGSAYLAQLLATGGTTPYVQWLVASGTLPVGLELDQLSGNIYGMPQTVTGTPFNFTVTVTDSMGAVSAAQAFSIIVTPSTVNPTLLSDCVTWITQVLNRQDLNANGLNSSVVNFYKLLTRKIPFDELMYISNECPLIKGQAAYDLDTIVDVNGNLLDPQLKSIYSIRCTFGPQNGGNPAYANQPNSVRLRRSATRLYDAIGYTQPGQTSTYSRFGKKIVVNPPPNASNWTIRFRYWGIAPLYPIAINTPLIMDDDWAELIRWEGLYRAYYMLGNTTEAMALVQPATIPLQPGAPRRRVMSETGIIPRLWNDLCGTLSARENADEDFSINPVVRDYTQRA